MDKLTLAGCVIKNHNGILLLHRIKRDWYELPGGKIDEQESAEETAKRELKEEILCDIKVKDRLGSKDFEEDGYIMTYIWFLAGLKRGQIPRIGEPNKFDHLRYVAPKDLKHHRLSPNMENLAAELENKKIILL